MNKRTRNSLAVTLGTAILLPSLAWSGLYIPSVPTIGQETDMWCWAASTEMILETLGEDVEQCELANSVFDRDDCCDSETPDECVKGHYFTFSPGVAGDDFGYTATRNTNPTFEDIKGQITASGGIPMGAGLRWTGGGGHVVVIVGWDEKGDADSDKWILVNDPWPVDAGVTHRWVRWDHFQGSTETVDGYGAHTLEAIVMDIHKEVGCEAAVGPAPEDFALNRWGDLYTIDKYLKIDQLDIEVIGTESVSDEMMQDACSLIESMVTAIEDPNDQAMFAGHQAILITDADSDLSTSGGVSGQRNTGGAGYSLFNTDLICATHADTINSDAPMYRAWNTPVHEFGHAIELTLGMRGQSDTIYSENSLNYNATYAGEYFAWGTQKWFDSASGADRDDMETWEYDYFATVFDVDNTWVPECP